MNKFRERLSEKSVAFIWQQQAVSNLVTDTGQQVRILFPGRTCTDGGCDFRDALLDIGGKIITGNVEVHVLSSQWYSHGHHQDTKYNDIVLHVVMWHNHSSSTVLQSGDVIPTICLSSCLSRPFNELNHEIKLQYQHTSLCTAPCSGEFLFTVLNITGKERFITKAASFQKSLLLQDAGQVLFRSIGRALGYSKNTKPFEKLADRVTLRTLEKSSKEKDIIRQQALMLGTAGLLPSQRLKQKYKFAEELEVAVLETIWQSSNIAGIMDQYEWCFFRVRPDNFPTRRLVALSYLVGRYYQVGLLQGILNLVGEAHGKKGHRWIEDGIMISEQGYWANHIDFGSIIKRSSALLGRSKAAEIIVNVVLPFAYAWGALYTDPELQEKAINIYGNYPGLENNQLVRYMKQLLLLRPDFSLSSAQQQGLIHIFKNYCRSRNCSACPITLSQS